jgi:hypothetical protein
VDFGKEPKTGDVLGREEGKRGELMKDPVKEGEDEEYKKIII